MGYYDYGYYYSSGPSIFDLLGWVIAITLALTIALYIFVIPERKDGNLGNKFLQILHDLFNFKSLWLEHILKALYVLSTVFIVVAGIFVLFAEDALTGLLAMIVGPVLIRFTYEGLMMFIILVKKVISIDNKLGGKGIAPEASKAPEEEE